MALLEALHSTDSNIRVPGNISAFSTSSVKGLVHRVLDTGPFLMVLDHLDAPSRVVTGIVKDLHYYGRTPLIFASRSPHMEDIGALRPLCANKSERLELKNLPAQISEQGKRSATAPRPGSQTGAHKQPYYSSEEFFSASERDRLRLIRKNEKLNG